VPTAQREKNFGTDAAVTGRWADGRRDLGGLTHLITVTSGALVITCGYIDAACPVVSGGTEVTHGVGHDDMMSCLHFGLHRVALRRV